MGYTIFGKIVDEKGVSIPFATLFASDNSGKSIQPPNSTTSDNEGKFKVSNLTDNDFITVKMVGNKTVTISAKSVKPVVMPNGAVIRSIQIKLVPDASVTQLDEIQIVSDKTNKSDTTATIQAKFNFGIPLMVLGGVMIIFGTYKLLAK